MLLITAFNNIMCFFQFKGLLNHLYCPCLVLVDPPEKLQQTCPTCPLLLSVDSQQAVDAARLTLARYKRQSLLAAGLGVKKITRAAAQVQLDTQS